jgi:phosphoserine phosphatase
VSSNHQVRARAKAHQCRVQASGWNPEVRGWLETLIAKGSGRGLPVVFDFDNTLICGDVSEVTLATLVNSGLLPLEHLAPTLSPPFRPPGGTRITLESCHDIAEYYEAFLTPSAHGGSDPSPFSNGYVWAVEVMEGLRPLDVIRATRAAYQQPQPSRPAFVEVTPGKTVFPIPFFYPEMVELMAELLRHDFEVWIVSAGNVWSMRWMILEVLNPMLRQLGVSQALRADHLLGVSTLLADHKDRLYKDALLVRDHPGYAALDERALAAFRLTSRLQFPVPAYSGKVACLFDALGRNPYLCIGDSPGDHAMMTISQHRLWIARIEQPSFQRKLLDWIRKNGSANWMVQPTLTRVMPGFVPDWSEIVRRLGSLSAEVRETRRILNQVASLTRRARSRGSALKASAGMSLIGDRA